MVHIFNLRLTVQPSGVSSASSLKTIGIMLLMAITLFTFNCESGEIKKQEETSMAKIAEQIISEWGERPEVILKEVVLHR
jgi:hypothetical protein